MAWEKAAGMLASGSVLLPRRCCGRTVQGGGMSRRSGSVVSTRCIRRTPLMPSIMEWCILV